MSTCHTSFGKHLRLLTSSDFKPVFDDAVFRASHKYLLILARPNQLGHPRLGLVIAKKNIRKAVHRNRIKRIARESFRFQQHNLQGIDAIVLARRELDTFNNDQIRSFFDQQWLRITKKSRKSNTE